MALVIAGERSGVGKTTVTLALLSFLSRKGCQVQSFKVGPDYIDPMFHSSVTNRPCRNLDPVLTSEAYVQSCFARHCQGVDYALVEGVMGLFDGVKGNVEANQLPINFASTAHIARLLDLPVLLVIDCSRLSGSVAAIAHGYRSFDPKVKIAGVVLNRVGSDRHLELLKDALEPLHLPVLGVFNRQDDITIPDRHLGLVPTAEINQLDVIFDRLAQLGENCFYWESLLQLLKSSQPSKSKICTRRQSWGARIKSKIAIARDRAFNFYYQDNLDILEELGAQLIPWSPMEDKGLPEGIQGLYFGGGFPEIYGQQLADNKSARDAVRTAIQAGMPTYAECGGLMYLCEQLVDFGGKAWQMVGVLPTTAIMSKALTLGYRQATALQDSLLLKAGEVVWGHEFHRSQLTSNPKKPLFETRGYKLQSPVSYEGWRLAQLHASYIHLHFGGCQSYLEGFLKGMARSLS
ncbi:MAG: cobyrinate a,c-diamide synthase [Xenococcaceae cyanobacterium]